MDENLHCMLCGFLSVNYSFWYFKIYNPAGVETYGFYKKLIFLKVSSFLHHILLVIVKPHALQPS